MKYFAIGDEDTVLGMALAGVDGRAVTSADEAAAVLQEAIEDHEAGIILITERTADMVRTQVDKFVFTRSFPLIVEIPDRLGPVPERPALRETVNRAIGVSV